MHLNLCEFELLLDMGIHMIEPEVHNMETQLDPKHPTNSKLYYQNFLRKGMF